MQGIIRDDKGDYVKSAIVRLLKISDAVSDSDEEAVKYAETDEDGKFVISDLEQGERYIIEVHVEVPEPEVVKAVPEPEPEIVKAEPEQELEQENELELENEPDQEDDNDWESDREFSSGLIDSLDFSGISNETFKMNLCINSLYNIGFNPKDKSYLKKNNVW